MYTGPAAAEIRGGERTDWMASCIAKNGLRGYITPTIVIDTHAPTQYTRTPTHDTIEPTQYTHAPTQ